MCSTRSKQYIRPELTRADLKSFQIAKYVAINPARGDISTALRAAEKQCKTNLLPLTEALAAFDTFKDDALHSVFVGHKQCPRHYKYPLDCTVLQLIRLTDRMTGVICDRQSVTPGGRTRAPLRVGPEGLLSGKSPATSLNNAIQFFWPYLSDEDLDELHTQCALYVMGSWSKARDAEKTIHKNRLKQRKQSLERLFRGVKPRLTTEFEIHCRLIARELQDTGKQDITWREFKQTYPGIASRYQTDLLKLQHKQTISSAQLRQVEYPTDFDLRLIAWEGPMRQFEAPQLLLQIRNIPLHFRFSQGTLFHQELSAEIKQLTRNTEHPTTENTIGWLRVHLDDDNRLCFIDEVQSDALELAYELTRKARYTSVANEFMDACSNWNLHAFATVYQWALLIGYHPAIHSRESAAEKDMMTESERKWRTYYDPIIRKYKLKPESFTNYPADIYVAGAAERSS